MILRSCTRGLAAALLLVVAGCGGENEKIGDAVVTTEPGAADVAPVPGEGAGAVNPASTGAEAKPAGGATAESAAVKAEGFGTLKGQVVFEGDPPATDPLVAQGKAEKDPEVCAANGAIPNQKLVVDPETKGVKWALVYIPRPTAVSPEAESEAASQEFEFDQSGCLFVPHVLGMPKGAKLVIKSSDPVGHNVNVKVDNNNLNTAVPPGAALPPIDLKFDSGRPGEVVCDIHPWMKAWWMVAKNPYIAVTDEKGNFEIKNVPAGTQKVVVWTEATHPKFLTAPSGDPVNVKANEETTHTFRLTTAQVK